MCAKSNPGHDIPCYYSYIRQTTHHITRFVSRLRLNYCGVVVGFVGYFVALTPSLMPRPALFMGILAGVGFAIGYGLGTASSSLARHYHVLPEPNRRTKRRAWQALAIITPIFIAVISLLARYWQNEQRTLLDQPLIHHLGTLTIISVAAGIFVIICTLAAGLRWLYRYARRALGKLTFLPPYMGAIVAFIVVVIIIFEMITGLLERTAVVMIDRSYSATNSHIDPAFKQPSSRYRSGSPGALAHWEGLGVQGRRFVATGPSAADIAKFTHQPAKAPIRVYAGIDNADGREQQVALAMRELERTGAFERKILAVVTPTGTGWIESETVAALEYMHGGDTAIVSSQYSYLPSGLAFLIDQGDATAMAKALLHAVENKLQTMPPDTRPKLIAYGLSLGSYGGQSDFTGEADFARRLDGGLFVGTPGFSEPWRTITRERDSGSPQIEPVYHDARVIKFATSSTDIIDDINPRYKIVYYQYATDPFVWFDASLLYSRPDWTREAPGRGVTPHLHWFPVITFLQIAVDQIYALTISGDNGHDYSHDTVAALAAATKPDDWSAAKSRALQSHIAPASTK